MILRLLAALTLAVAAHPAYAQTPGSSPCTAEAIRHFDFWEGRWVVRAANGALDGHNTLSVVLGECVVHEHYTTPMAMSATASPRTTPPATYGIRP